MATEDQNIQALADALEREQRIEIGIQKDSGVIQRTVEGYGVGASLYASPARMQRMIDELRIIIRNYVQRAGNRGKLMARAAISDFLEHAERWDITQRRVRLIGQMNVRQADRRLSLYMDELQREYGILRQDLRIFKKNARIAGFTNRDVFKQLVQATRDKAGVAVDFAKRTRQMAAMAVRRERASGEIAEYRKIAKPSEEWQWIAVSTSPCPDCLPRAGKVMSFREWQAVGIPGAGRTICGAKCRCRLIPVTIAEDMFPTVKEFKWDAGKTVLATPGELRRFRARAHQPPQLED